MIYKLYIFNYLYGIDKYKDKKAENKWASNLVLSFVRGRELGKKEEESECVVEMVKFLLDVVKWSKSDYGNIAYLCEHTESQWMMHFHISKFN